MDSEELKSKYPELLRKYLFEGKEEEALYGAYKLGKECFEAKIGLEDIMNLHTQCLEDILKALPPSKVHDIVLKSSNLLIEFSIRFGLVCQNYFEMLQQTDERIRNAFYQAGEALTAGLDIQRMLAVILDIVKNLIEAAGCAVMLLEADRTVIKASEGLDTENEFFKDFLHEVIKEGKAKFVYDLREKNLPMILKDGREIRSVLALPLNLKGMTRGVLGICLTYPHHYEEKEINLLTSFAYQVASAIDNAYLFKELQRHDKTIEALYTIDKVVSQTLYIENILRGALTKAMEVTETEAGGIYLLEENGETLSLKAHFGISEELSRALSKIKVGQGVSGTAVKTGKPVALDIAKYPSPELLAPLIKGGIVSIASSPLLAKGKVIGAISLAYKKHRIFSQDYLDLLASIGSQIGVAIQNATLFSELEKHHDTLKALYAIESVVSRSLNLEEIFNVALSKVLEVTDTETGTLYSFDGEVLRLKAFKGLSSEFIEKALIRKMGEGIPGIAAQSKKAITMDISQFPSPNLLPYVTKEGLVSFIGTPLLSKEKVVGALALGRKKKRIFTQDDLDLLLSIGNVIVIAVENAQLYKESKESLQKLQKAYEELQTLDKMKDEFISNVSHELKTPLISIKGYGELLYDEKLDGLSDRQKKSLEAIIRNADRLTRLIDSILFISKLQAGKIEFHFELLDPDEIVRACINDFKSMMDKKQITLEKDIPEISRVLGDRDKFVEVISNLLDNAVKFTPEGGKISIKAWNEREFVHLTVSDNGIGISADIIPKLFTRFYQVDASTVRKYGGAGLGLYITKNIIDAFKGKIWIESEVGKGTTVHVLLPIAKEDD
jgi:signal transduction histidine kinase